MCLCAPAFSCTGCSHSPDNHCWPRCPERGHSVGLRHHGFSQALCHTQHNCCLLFTHCPATAQPLAPLFSSLCSPVISACRSCPPLNASALPRGTKQPRPGSQPVPHHPAASPGPALVVTLRSQQHGCVRRQESREDISSTEQQALHGSPSEGSTYMTSEIMTLSS